MSQFREIRAKFEQQSQANNNASVSPLKRSGSLSQTYVKKSSFNLCKTDQRIVFFDL